MKTSDDLKILLSKKRVKLEEKLEWVKEIINISLRLTEEKGKFVDVKKLDTRPKSVNYKSLNIQYWTLNKLPGQSDEYILDIWAKDKNKVFSVRWRPTEFNKLPGENDQYVPDILHKNKGEAFSVRWEPTDITTFKRDEWLYDLFE